MVSARLVDETSAPVAVRGPAHGSGAGVPSRCRGAPALRYFAVTIFVALSSRQIGRQALGAHHRRQSQRLDGRRAGSAAADVFPYCDAEDAVLVLVSTGIHCRCSFISSTSREFHHAGRRQSQLRALRRALLEVARTGAFVTPVPFRVARPATLRHEDGHCFVAAMPTHTGTSTAIDAVSPSGGAGNRPQSASGMAPRRYRQRERHGAKRYDQVLREGRSARVVLEGRATGLSVEASRSVTAWKRCGSRLTLCCSLTRDLADR